MLWEQKAREYGLKEIWQRMFEIDFQVKELTPVIEFIDCQIANVDELGLI